MLMDFHLIGSCPNWTLADPAAVALLLLVDENYVLDNYSQYYDELRQKAYLGNALLVSSEFGPWIRIYLDEEPEVQSTYQVLLNGSYLRVPSGNLVCSMAHKLSTSRMDKHSQHKCVAPGVYRLDVFLETKQDSKNQPNVLIFLKPYDHELPKEFEPPYIPGEEVDIWPHVVQCIRNLFFGRPRKKSRSEDLD